MGTESPLVSIVMPVYNALPWLSEAIESMLSQSYDNFEFIIVDDGSSDGSREVLEQYAAKDQRIRLVFHDENKGVPTALNNGVKLSSGKYIARMDADDISLPNRLEAQVNYLEGNQSCGVVGGWMYRIRKKGDIKLKKYPETNEELKLLLIFECCFSHSTVVIRKEILHLLPFVYDERFRSAQDYDLWARLKDLCDFYCLQEPAIYRRELESSVSMQARTSKAKRERVNLIYQYLFDSSGLSERCSLDLHKKIVHREERWALTPKIVEEHLECIFSLYPSAENKDDVRRWIFDSLRKDVVFSCKYVLYRLKRRFVGSL
ncbi:glycosyltransferase [Desulfurispirillum indicum]|uniref:glycosyltransferase family 2 protein n=1 Tax=Desulfurispirillum indicum TaxID=936456 RepID=UPI001CF9CF2A|nr:glycosyltransferase family A protein [Desulfurispirillum indicum]UCZ56946.1 glycosyltransferase [Desulfurispirillum indicum]